LSWHLGGKLVARGLCVPHWVFAILAPPPDGRTPIPATEMPTHAVVVFMQLHEPFMPFMFKLFPKQECREC